MFFRKKKEEEKKPKTVKKLASIAFFIAIPANFVIGGSGLIAAGQMVADGTYRLSTTIFFIASIIGTIFISRTLHLSRVRVFIHETKHALVVLLTGNKVRGFHVEEEEGNVEFALYKDRAQYGPFIALAPYCLPLFALPALITGIIFDTDENLVEFAAVALGVALGFDFETAFHDLYPEQSDFKQVAGGFVASALYISSVIFLCGSMSLVWAVGGRYGFIVVGKVMLVMGVRLAEKIPEVLRRWASQ